MNTAVAPGHFGRGLRLYSAGVAYFFYRLQKKGFHASIIERIVFRGVELAKTIS
jgi:hypothetical protein